MQTNRQHLPLRHLPPTAVPFGSTELNAGLNADPASLHAFRAKLARYFGTPDAFLAASGRTAFFLLLSGLSAESPTRAEVVLPAYTCPALAKVILDVGLTPVFVDIEPKTFGYEMEALTTAVSPQTLAIIVVHPFGIPQPVAPVNTLAHEQGAVVIEDAAQALGARWDGQPVGVEGDFGLYSLGPGKPLSTGGGGIVVSSKPENQARLSRWWAELPQPGRITSALALLRQVALQLAFHPTGWWVATRVGVQKIGEGEASWGYRVRGLTTVQAGVGTALLSDLTTINNCRRENAAAILAGLVTGKRLRKVRVAAAAVPIYLRLPILTGSLEGREQLYKRLWNEGIGVGRMYTRPLPAIFPGYAQKRFPGAETIAQRLLTLPTHHYVAAEDINRMCRICSSRLYSS
ncbi:MAG: DegT/DnrJ/EryC1/StrS family aminotransferase [Anaerolineales bacterium]|nr:DegT/DnrJ/EryC1/StrS family aminotransferase [Anaerolineales bacterium]